MLENTYIIMNRMFIGRNTNIKYTSGEVMVRNENHVIGNWRKGEILVIK